ETFTLAHQQMTQLVLLVREQQRDRLEPISRTQAVGRADEQRREIVGLEQLHLARLRALPRLLVLARLVREPLDAALELAQLRPFHSVRLTARPARGCRYPDLST